MSDLVAHFEKIRSEQGEEAYQKAKRNFALGMVLKPRGDEFVKQAFPDLDIEALKAEAAKTQTAQQAAPPPVGVEAVLQAIRQQMPNVKSQAQYNLFMQAFDALRISMNAAFGLDRENFEKGKQALDLLMGAALKITEGVQRLQDDPDAATSKVAEDFKTPPKQFHELDLQKALLVELSLLTSLDDLQKWYDMNRHRLDSVVSQSLRNSLFDAIREKRNSFAN